MHTPTFVVPNMPKAIVPTPAAPVHGTCRLAVQPQPGSAGRIVINEHEYSLDVGPAGYTLTYLDGSESHTVSPDLNSCTCPDHTYRVRVGGCKHRKALGVLVSRLEYKAF